MENVPNVIYKKNIKQFSEWLSKLESLGYKCFWKILNAKDFGVPQNRERCFMVSLLGDYFYEFPEGQPLDKKLSDLLEDNVDEKYFLYDIQLIASENKTFNSAKIESKLPKKGVVPTILSHDRVDPKCVQLDCSGGGDLLGRL